MQSRGSRQVRFGGSGPARTRWKFLKKPKTAAGRRFTTFRRKRWVDTGEGIVHKRVRLIRVKGKHPKPPRKDPGPRPLPRPQHPRKPAGPQPFGVYRGEFGRIEATRLLNRAGFGPAPGQAEKLAKMGMKKAVLSLTRPEGPAKLYGKLPVDQDGLPLAPADSWGHDHLWWLDRMVEVIGASAGITVDDLDRAPFTEKGGVDGALLDLGDRTESLLDQLNTELTA